MNMEFLTRNYIATSTNVSVESNTSGAAFLYDRRALRQYISNGYDSTSTTITFSLPQLEPVSRIILENHNFKNYSIYYNGITTNLFSLTTTCGTNSSSWTGNSATSQYLIFATLTSIDSISIKVNSTTVSGLEKRIGQVWVCDKLYQFDRNPDRSGFSPDTYAKEVKHEMSDGGTLLYKIRDKVRVGLKLTHRDDFATLKSAIYDPNSEVVFAPFPTGTSWDQQIWEMNLVGGFDFRKPSMNFLSAGYDGSIRLEETPA